MTFGRHEVVDPDVARLHHLRVPLQPMTPPLPYTVEDDVVPRTTASRKADVPGAGAGRQLRPDPEKI